jgi:parallel beta-helix repeat protein
MKNSVKRRILIFSAILVTSFVLYLVLSATLKISIFSSYPNNNNQPLDYNSPYEGYQNEFEHYSDDELGILITITVKSFEDFLEYDLPGNGSKENPFIIDGKKNKLYRYQIDISNITGFLSIQKCFFRQSNIKLLCISEGGINITDNIFSCGSTGVRLTAVHSITEISGNIFDGGIDGGIRLAYSSNIVLKNNHFYNSGLYIVSTLTYLNSYLVEDNYVNEKKLGYFFKKENLVIDEENDYGQLLFLICKNIIISNIVVENTSHGIYCFSSTNVTIRNSSISKCSFGLFLRKCHNLHIENNELFQNKYPLYFSSSGGKIYNNFVFNNLFGVDIYHSSNCLLLDNIVGGNSHIGIKFWNSQYNEIINNIIEYNNARGIYLLDNSEGNIIYHNIFHNNRINAQDDCQDNVWYDVNAKLGNYWSDYDYRGIYTIPGIAEAVDLYPQSTKMFY